MLWHCTPHPQHNNIILKNRPVSPHRTALDTSRRTYKFLQHLYCIISGSSLQAKFSRAVIFIPIFRRIVQCQKTQNTQNCQTASAASSNCPATGQTPMPYTRLPQSLPPTAPRRLQRRSVMSPTGTWGFMP